MTFKEFVEATGYAPMTVAQAFLYSPSKRVQTIAKTLGFEPTDQEKTDMRYMIAGKKTFSELYGEAA